MDERRFSPRLYQPYPARVRGVDAGQQAFKEDTLIENLSTGGLYLRLARTLEEGADVSVAVRLSIGPTGPVPVLKLMARCVVVRTEPQPDGTCGVAVEFKRRRLL